MKNQPRPPPPNPHHPLILYLKQQQIICLIFLLFFATKISQSKHKIPCFFLAPKRNRNKFIQRIAMWLIVHWDKIFMIVVTLKARVSPCVFKKQKPICWALYSYHIFQLILPPPPCCVFMLFFYVYFYNVDIACHLCGTY